MPLFQLSPFETLKTEKQEQERPERGRPPTRTDTAQSFQKEVVEFNIEKNRTMRSLLHSFDIDSKPEYSKENK
jgi:hypothetical protein